jgi:hypothetical protein
MPCRSIVELFDSIDPLLSFELAGSSRSNDSGKTTLSRQVQRRNAGREEWERKQKRRAALRPLERVVRRHPARVAP